MHVPSPDGTEAGAADLEAALHGYFGARAEVIGLELKDMFRIGRRSLIIGVTVLVLCTLASSWVSTLAPTPLRGVIAESLIILGWVANWKPLEFFLYGWWPMRRRRRLFERLAAATVELRPGAGRRPERPRTAASNPNPPSS